MQVLQETLLTILQAVILATVPVLTGMLVVYIRNKATQTNNEITKQCLAELGDVVSAAVAHTAQSYVDTLKKDGTFTVEEHHLALKKTKETALAALMPFTKEFLSSTRNLQSLLEAKIEEAVRAQK